MKLSVLDMVQDVLSSIDSESVNSINDTPESQQVSRILRSCYFDLVTRDPLPEHKSLIQLDASTDGDKPVVMTIPDGCSQLLSVLYDIQTVTDTETNYQEMRFIPQDQFLYENALMKTTEDNIQQFQFGLFRIKYYTDRAPSRYTVIADETLIFDSYDSTVDTTLQTTKTLCRAVLNPPWQFTDEFVPTLNDQQFPLLLNECKSVAWATMKQSVNPKIEQQAKRGWASLQITKHKATHKSELDRLPNYGRK